MNKAVLSNLTYFFAASLKFSSRLAGAALCFVLIGSQIHADPIAFPSGLIPLTSVQYVSAPDANGIELVLGYSTFPAFATLRSLPTPSTNQQFTNPSIELAPGQFFSNVYVPTPAELAGNFQDFDGPVLNPFSNGLTFPQNIIPASLLGGIYAFRVESPAAAAPEPNSLYTLALIVIAVAARLLVRRIV